MCQIYDSDGNSDVCEARLICLGSVGCLPELSLSEEDAG